MKSDAILRHLPGPIASTAASLGGLRLRRRRYGGDLEARVERALERDYWEADRWREWLDRRLHRVLSRAREEVPHYRDLALSDGPEPQALGGWPLLSKRHLRVGGERLLSARSRRSGLFRAHTSGSSGTPVALRRSRDAERAWYGVYEARVRRWHGVSLTDRWAIFGGRAIVPPARSRPPFWVVNAGLSQLYCSSYHLAPDTAAAYAAALIGYRPRYVVGYPSALASLASFALDRDLELPALEVAITNGEPLSRRQRELIGAAFSTSVRDTWGMTEMVGGASECAAGALHLWPEVGLIEVLEERRDVPVAPGASGRLICTGLLERAMPLIRYEVGDLGWIDPAGDCPCGRRLPRLAGLIGRLDDVIRTPDGREIGRLDPVLKGDFDIRQAQIRQTGPATLVLRIVPAEGYSERTRRGLERALRERVGDMEIRFEETELLPTGPGGKVRSVVSELP